MGKKENKRRRERDPRLTSFTDLTDVPLRLKLPTDRTFLAKRVSRLFECVACFLHDVCVRSNVIISGWRWQGGKQGGKGREGTLARSLFSSAYPRLVIRSAEVRAVTMVRENMVVWCGVCVVWCGVVGGDGEVVMIDR
jgi:hypothetical protein